MRCGHVVLVLAGCALAGCGFHSPAGAPDGPLPIPDGGVAESRSFGLPELTAGTPLAMTVDATRISLTPDAYTYGGLIAHGITGTRLWAQDSTDWSATSTVSAMGAGLWRGESFGAGDALDAFGVTNPAMMTLWLEGEVWLDASSSETFGLGADDVAFIDLAAPGSTSYARVLQNSIATPTAAVETRVAGWYPIRVGVANGAGALAFQFTHSEGASSLGPWTRDRLRARASTVNGTLRTVFGHRLLGGGVPGEPPVMHVEANGLLPTDTFDPLPTGSGGQLDWSARYFGQLYVGQAGAYTLLIDSDDGNRGLLDTQRGMTNWGQNPRPGLTMIPATLGAGWTDVTVDYDQAGGDHSLHVQLIRPDRTQIEIPATQLRPVEPAADRLVSSFDDGMHTIHDATMAAPGAPGIATFDIAGYLGETVNAIDVTFFVTSAHSDQLVAQLVAPGGAPIQIRGHNNVDTVQGAQTTIASDAQGAQAGLLKGPVAGRWQLLVTDDVAPGGGGDSQLISAKLTLHTQGGPDKIARQASWRSQPIDTMTQAIAVDSVTWQARVPTGGGVEVVVGTCQQADCSDVHWSGAVDPGKPLGVAPGRYLQLRVDMTSDGNREPELSALSIQYRKSP